MPKMTSHGDLQHLPSIKLLMGLGSVKILDSGELYKYAIEGCKQTGPLHQSNSFLSSKETVLTLPPLSSHPLRIIKS